MRVLITGATGTWAQAGPAARRPRASGHGAGETGFGAEAPAGLRAHRGKPSRCGEFHSADADCDTLVHLEGVPHPSPTKARQFREIDQVSLQASVSAAVVRRVAHFVYVSVAQPAPVMRAYQQVRAECEQTIRDSGLNASVLRPRYVLGSGHWWPWRGWRTRSRVRREPADRSKDYDCP